MRAVQLELGPAPRVPLVSMVLLGAPRTKKTSQRVLKFGRFNKIVPSPQYLAWRDLVVPAMVDHWLAATTAREPCAECSGLGMIPAGKFKRVGCHRCRGARQQAPALARPLEVCARFFRDAERGDLVGYLQGLADALQEAGVVADDKFIQSWDGSRLDKDSARPRVEVELFPLEAR